MANDFMAARKNEIVVFQPDDALRLEVRVDQETAWLTQQKIGELFGVGKAAVSKHLKNIFETGELVPERTVSKMETVQVEGFRKIRILESSASPSRGSSRASSAPSTGRGRESRVTQ